MAELGPCWEFFKLGFPGMLMLCSEWWAYEVLTVMAGVLGKEEVSAQAILMQILSLSFMVPLGTCREMSRGVVSYCVYGVRLLAQMTPPI